MLWNVIRSILIISTISCIVGGLFYVAGMAPEKGAVLGLLTQIIIYNIVRHYKESSIVVKMKELETDQIREFSKQGMELQCAHCKAEVFVPIRFDVENSFQCPACSNSNSIYVNVTVARETTPLNVDAITSKLIIDDEQRVKDEIIIQGGKDG